ncbi:MAG TPA: helix-turn-helix transcriptional regulator, partial [Pyrinomonadaceae bacterium]|nr:helix-turn-helix transcriptional regulator [Pyrinomonadaceae bacterium]
GRSSREKPERLGEKLTQIRSALGLSQTEILSRMGLAEKLNRDDISKYERGVREPSVLVMLDYARVAGICLDVLVDDDLDLPSKLPSKAKHS